MLFPDERDGWYPEFEQQIGPGRRVKITPLMSYSLNLCTLDPELSKISHSARLFQQYLLDQFVILHHMMNADRLMYLPRNQKKLQPWTTVDFANSLVTMEECRMKPIL